MDISRLGRIANSNQTESSSNSGQDKESVKEKDKSIFSKLESKYKECEREDVRNSILAEMEELQNSYIAEQKDERAKAYNTEIANLYGQLAQTTDKDQRYMIEDKIGELTFQNLFADLEDKLANATSQNERNQIIDTMKQIQMQYFAELENKADERITKEISEKYAELAKTNDPDERKIIMDEIRDAEFGQEMNRLQAKLNEVTSQDERDAIAAKIMMRQNEYAAENAEGSEQEYHKTVADLYEQLANTTDENQKEAILANIGIIENKYAAENSTGINRSYSLELSDLYGALSETVSSDQRDQIITRINEIETRREAENSAGNKKNNLNRLADLYAVLAETTDSTQRDSINSEISRLMQDMN